LSEGKSGALRWGYGVWLLAIAGFAALHAWHLSADFPNGTHWFCDWAKYTDEGWYGNGAIRAHLFGNWYVPGDFNPAAAVPLWPFVEWLLFFVTGVSLEAARGLAVACFFANLWLSYLLLRSRGPRWMAYLALTLLVTSPFLYCFSRLAILEPMQTLLLLGALNLAVRLPRYKRPVMAAVGLGAICALMALTKTTAVFLAPAVAWTILLPLWERKKIAIGCLFATGCTAAAIYGSWLALLASRGLLLDYRYFYFINKYDKPPEFYWPLVSFWWSFHGLLWIDHSLVLPAGLIVAAALIGWRSNWGRALWREPLFGASLLAAAGYILFMTLQNHPQPRYFAVPAFFCFFVVVLGASALVNAGNWVRRMGWTVVAVAALAAVGHGAQTLKFAAHPQYTWMNAATQLTQYIDAHPNGKRLLVSISGDQITLMTHLPTLCDDFGTQDLASKLAKYQPGWYATWNDLDPGTLEDLHTKFSLEQVASFPALDDPDRNVLVLFKLHPLPGGQVRNSGDQNLRVVLPGDKIGINLQ
jgi:4-amino-4-deoxy-L-arabinose transferase-like glycosyltransferase